MSAPAARIEPLRVFLSYTRRDLETAERVKKRLEGLKKVRVLWDRDIDAGEPFSEAIRELISSAHVFLTLITDRSKHRPWLHREEGYAMAMNVPILPIVIGEVREKDPLLAENLQAIRVREDLSDLHRQLQRTHLERAFTFSAKRGAILVEIGQSHETRTQLMVENSRRLLQRGISGPLRQRGALSSFCIPDQDIRDDIWDRREGPRPRTAFLRDLQRQERQLLEAHARAAGCRLVIDPGIDFIGGPDMLRARLESLMRFLESVKDHEVQIVTRDRLGQGNLTIVGDWFMAESLAPKPGEGYLQTVFTRHAPTVRDAVAAFDSYFEEACAKAGVRPQTSRGKAAAAVEARLRGLRRRRRA